MKGALLTLAAGLTLVTACGGPTADTGAATKAAADGGGEAAAIRYTDTRFHYVIDSPGQMKVTGDTTAAVIGPSERLTITVVQGTKASDPAGLAKADLTQLATLTGYKLDAGPKAVNINGKQAQKLVYEWTAGTSAVTGKADHLIGVRYYVPKDAGTLAIVEYGISSNQYDPQGADDVASTFRWQ